MRVYCHCFFSRWHFYLFGFDHIQFYFGTLEGRLRIVSLGCLIFWLKENKRTLIASKVDDGSNLKLTLEKNLRKKSIQRSLRSKKYC